MMKKIIALLLAALTLLAPMATSEEEFTSWKYSWEDETPPFAFLEGDYAYLWEDETHPFVFFEGDYAHLMESAEGFTVKTPVIKNAKMAAYLARALLMQEVDRFYPNGLLTTVHHDVETDIWFVFFDNWPLTLGGRACFAFSGEDARLIARWGEE